MNVKLATYLPGVLLEKTGESSYKAQSRLGDSEADLLKKFAKESGVSCSYLTRKLLVAKLLELQKGCIRA